MVFKEKKLIQYHLSTFLLFFSFLLNTQRAETFEQISFSTKHPILPSMSSQAPVTVSRKDPVCFPFGLFRMDSWWKNVVWPRNVGMEHFICPPLWSSRFSYQVKLLWFSSVAFLLLLVFCSLVVGFFFFIQFGQIQNAILKGFWENERPFGHSVAGWFLLTHQDVFSYCKTRKCPFCRLSYKYFPSTF